MSDIDTGRVPEAEPVTDADVGPDLFTVSVNGTGVNLTRTVDPATALNVIATVLGGGTAAPPAPVAYAPHTPPAPRASTQRDIPGGSPGTGDALDAHTTVGEYIDECGARQFPAKITAIGHFLQLKLGQSTFTKDEVKSQFRPAGEAAPGNFPRDFNEAISQRWIAEDVHNKGQYFVTTTGKKAIAAQFDKTTRRATASRRKKSSSATDNGDSSAAGGTEHQDLDAE